MDANKTDPEVLYPDILKDLRGYNYRVLVYHEEPRVLINESYVKSQFVDFLLAVGRKQNAGFNLIQPVNVEASVEFFENRLVDLTLNTGIIFMSSKDTKLFTYEETGYCALIPKSKMIFFKLLLAQPFNWKIWTALFSSIAVFAVIWRLFKNFGAIDSVWRVLAGISATFVGQSLEFRNNRRILTILLQIFIILAMFLGSLYQGELTAFMMESFEEEKLENFEELYESDLNLLTSPYFLKVMQNFENYETIKDRINGSGKRLNDQNFQELAENNYALIMPCSLAENILKKFELNDIFYLLDDQIFKYFVQLEASFLNPYINRLQLIMDWCFEGGLHKAWNSFMGTSVIKPELPEIRKFLNLGDFNQIFIIFGILLFIATLVFVGEIFYHKFGENFYMNWIYLKDEFYIRRIQWRRRNQRARVVVQIRESV